MIETHIEHYKKNLVIVVFTRVVRCDPVARDMLSVIGSLAELLALCVVAHHAPLPTPLEPRENFSVRCICPFPEASIFASSEESSKLRRVLGIWKHG